MALPLFAITLFVSAFLLFLVQPMMGKMILPKLGGTPQVWNTCMMFFQTALLVGYGYSHTVSTRLSLKKQLIVHCAFLLVPLLFLIPNGPFNITGWIPPTEDNPIPSTLFLLTMVVGVPFLVVSTSAPLLQRWFSFTGHPAAKDPYFLYGASNLGSLLALVCYPFLVEPSFILSTQAWIWLGGYLALGALIVLAAGLVWKSPGVVQMLEAPVEPLQEPAPMPAQAPEPSTAIQPAPAMRGVSRKKGAKLAAPGHDVAAETSVKIGHVPSDVMTWGRRLRWILLAAVPSSLMLGVTSYASIDLSPFPLLWVIPLALYLLSFILVFSKWPAVWTEGPHTAFLFIGPLAILAMCLIILTSAHNPSHAFISFVGFFVVATMCHGELAKDRPSPKHLTEFFLLMSVGGMVGGVFNGLFAPLVFTGVVEYPLAIILACMVRPKTAESGWTDDLILRSSPDLEKWVQTTGDQMSVAFGSPARRSNYLLHYFLDIVFAALILGIAYWIRSNADRFTGWGWTNLGEPNKNGLIKIMQFIGFAPRDREGLDYWMENWWQSAYNAGVFGVPMVIAFFFSARPMRFGLAVAGILIANLYFHDRERNVDAAVRTYFGRIRVLHSVDEYAPATIEGEANADIRTGKELPQYHYLMHGTTHHGKNYYDPPELSRLATTYYHRWGPVGIVMERYNWLKGPQNTYWADNRLPAALVGLGAAPLAVGPLPIDQLYQLWSEPPVATIGLGTGTMASYGRPLQHVIFYEIDEKIRSFSLPLEGGKTYFNYLEGALKRGSHLEVIMGDARQSMQRSTPWPKAVRDAKASGKEPPSRDSQPGTVRPGTLFSLNDEGKTVQDKNGFRHPEREKYYKVIEVDAFSSDAIPIHLTTKEAIELYMDHLQDDGVLCMHTSNRHMDLTKPIVDIAVELKLTYIIGHDPGSERVRGLKHRSMGHFGSEYVMLTRSKDSKTSDGKLIPGRLNIKALEKNLLDPTKPFNADTNPVVGLDADKKYGRLPQWYIPTPPGMRLWTDDYSNIVSILR